MYVGQAAAFRQPAVFSPAAAQEGNKVKQKDGGNVVNMLNEQAKKPTTLDEARARFNRIREKLENFVDPDMEKLLDGYIRRVSTYQRNAAALQTHQEKRSRFSSLDGSYQNTNQALSQARDRYQASVEANGDLATPGADGSVDTSEEGIAQRDLLDQISKLEKTLSSLNTDMDHFIQEMNASASSAYEGKQTEAYTRGNIGYRLDSEVEALQKEVKSSSDAIIDYCKRYGLTPYDFEQYLGEKSLLSEQLYTAQQDLFFLMEQEGEDTQGLKDRRA